MQNEHGKVSYAGYYQNKRWRPPCGWHTSLCFPISEVGALEFDLLWKYVADAHAACLLHSCQEEVLRYLTVQRVGMYNRRVR